MTLVVKGEKLNMNYQLSFTTPFKAKYEVTKCGNLRCFPSCREFHYSKSFCGTSLEVRIRGAMSLHDGLEVYGVFNQVNHQNVQNIRGKDPSLRADLVTFDPKTQEAVYIFQPYRKWYCKSLPRCSDFVFTVYLMKADRLLERFDSTPIQLYRRRNPRQTKKKERENSINQDIFELLMVDDDKKAEIASADSFSTDDQQEDTKNNGSCCDNNVPCPCNSNNKRHQLSVDESSSPSSILLLPSPPPPPSLPIFRDEEFECLINFLLG